MSPGVETTRETITGIDPRVKTRARRGRDPEPRSRASIPSLESPSSSSSSTISGRSARRATPRRCTAPSHERGREGVDEEREGGGEGTGRGSFFRSRARRIRESLPLVPPGYPTLRSRNAISSPGVHSIILLRLLFVVLPISPSLCLCRSRKSARRLSSAQTHTHARAPVFSLSLSLYLRLCLRPSLSFPFTLLPLSPSRVRRSSGPRFPVDRQAVSPSLPRFGLPPGRCTVTSSWGDNRGVAAPRTFSSERETGTRRFVGLPLRTSARLPTRVAPRMPT